MRATSGARYVCHDTPSTLRAKNRSVAAQPAPLGYAATSIQYSRLLGMYCTSMCHGTKPGCTSWTADGCDQCTPSADVRRSMPVDCAWQPPFTAFTDHMIQTSSACRTMAGDTIAMPRAD